MFEHYVHSIENIEISTNDDGSICQDPAEVLGELLWKPSPLTGDELGRFSGAFILLGSRWEHKPEVKSLDTQG